MDSKFALTEKELRDVERGHCRMMRLPDVEPIRLSLARGTATEQARQIIEELPADVLDEVIRMRLQPGQTMMKNGVTYILNENHRWTREEHVDGPHFKVVQSAPYNGEAAWTVMRQDGTAIATHRDKQTALDAARLHNDQATKTGADKQMFGRPFLVVDVEADENGDGITDAARVGVAAFDVPPPPRKVPRIAGLKGEAKKAEGQFARAFERAPNAMADKALALMAAMTKPGDPITFGTDDAKQLSPFWASEELEHDLGARSHNRATLNTALHQTANALAKRAFVKHLDTLKKGSSVLVTVGGCGAGKGYALKNIPEALEYKATADAVWDSAGDQNATENPWILQECKKRGLQVSYVYVHADPKTQWAHPERGVVKRAQDPADGRMVDAKVFADSYAIGARNHQAFFQQHASDPHVAFLFLKNGDPPELLDKMPVEALEYDRRELVDFATRTVKQQPSIPAHVKQGALQGTQLWSD